MEPIPEPAGSRHVPPTHPWTAVGAGMPGKVVMIALDDPDESRMVADSFRDRGWRVEEGGVVAAALVGGYDLLLTDDLDGVATFVDELHPEPAKGVAGGTIVFVLSDPDDESTAQAWQSGADMVIPRPFDADDPLKTGGLSA